MWGTGMERKPSEIITDFLNFLESAKNEYESAYADVGAEERKEQTFLHDLEFALNKNERNKVATRFQQRNVMLMIVVFGMGFYGYM